MFQVKKSDSGITVGNILLLIFSFALIFLIPLLPATFYKPSYNILFSIIFFLSILSLHGRIKRRMIVIAIIAFVTEWIAEIFKMDILKYTSSLVNVVFFQIIVIRLIIQIARSKEVNTGVILESVNAYLLLGLMFTSLVAVLNLHNSEALNFNTERATIQDFIYYTFVTISTLGYGDVTPQEPIGKSLSILISVSGQLYIAIIIAMLVGKFSGSMAAAMEKEI